MEVVMSVFAEAIVKENNEIAPGIFSMWLSCAEIAAKSRPGQFLEIYTGDSARLLPRPISICDVMGSDVRVVYQVVGVGTEIFSNKKQGDGLKIIGALGNGYDLGQKGPYILAGGGVGVPPLLYLARELLKNDPNADLKIFLGFRTYPFLIEDFKTIGLEPSVAIEDRGEGTVLDNMNKCALPDDALTYSCGPKPMLRAVARWAEERKRPCYVSMEERMACGLGACVGCVVKLRSSQASDGWEYKKVCKDGPVFDARQVIWDE